MSTFSSSIMPSREPCVPALCPGSLSLLCSYCVLCTPAFSIFLLFYTLVSSHALFRQALWLLVLESLVQFIAQAYSGSLNVHWVRRIRWWQPKEVEPPMSHRALWWLNTRHTAREPVLCVLPVSLWPCREEIPGCSQSSSQENRRPS